MNWYKIAQQLSCQEIINRIDAQFPLSSTQSGEIANLGSISASLNEWQELKGIRDIPSLCPNVVSKNKSNLAKKIETSGHIMPLIVVVQSEDEEGLYILEGSHRYDAICELGYKTFPALVVIDMEKLCNELV